MPSSSINLEPGEDRIALATDVLAVRCRPGQGGVIDSVRDLETGAEALWHWRRVQPAMCGRSLGPGGEASIATFVDVFIGGWFTMFPAVGFPTPGDSVGLLHGELVRLTWHVMAQDQRMARLRVETVRAPFVLERDLMVAGAELRIEDRISNVGAESAPYAFGYHPCLARATFAGGAIALEVEQAYVPQPPFDPSASTLMPGTVTWPSGHFTDGESTDLSSIPTSADGRVDHICMTLRAGRCRISAPRYRRILELRWELGSLGHLLLWQNFLGAGGWPFWGGADTFALEPSTVPGRSMDEAHEAGALHLLAPGQTAEYAMAARWTQ